MRMQPQTVRVLDALARHRWQVEFGPSEDTGYITIQAAWLGVQFEGDGATLDEAVAAMIRTAGHHIGILKRAMDTPDA